MKCLNLKSLTGTAKKSSKQQLVLLMPCHVRYIINKNLSENKLFLSQAMTMK